MPDTAKEKATFIVSGVTHSYNQTNALNSIELTINEGECVAIVGPSGGGKTTLLNILNSSIKPSTGKVIIQGKNSTNYTPRELKSVRSRISLIPQNLALVDSFRVWQNVITGKIGQHGFLKLLKNLTIPAKEQLTEIHSILNRVGIEEKLFSITKNLSGGQKQRVAVARSIFQSPAAILADEPVSSVDPARAKNLVELLIKISNEENTTLLMSLHNLDLAMEKFPRVIGIRNGTVCFDRSPDQISKKELQELYQLEENEILEDG